MHEIYSYRLSDITNPNGSAEASRRGRRIGVTFARIRASRGYEFLGPEGGFFFLRDTDFVDLPRGEIDGLAWPTFSRTMCIPEWVARTLYEQTPASRT